VVCIGLLALWGVSFFLGAVGVGNMRVDIDKQIDKMTELALAVLPQPSVIVSHTDNIPTTLALLPMVQVHSDPVSAASASSSGGEEALGGKSERERIQKKLYQLTLKDAIVINAELRLINEKLRHDIRHLQKYHQKNASFHIQASKVGFRYVTNSVENISGFTGSVAASTSSAVRDTTVNSMCR